MRDVPKTSSLTHGPGRTTPARAPPESASTRAADSRNLVYEVGRLRRGLRFVPRFCGKAAVCRWGTPVVRELLVGGRPSRLADGFVSADCRLCSSFHIFCSAVLPRSNSRAPDILRASPTGRGTHFRLGLDHWLRSRTTSHRPDPPSTTPP